MGSQSQIILMKTKLPFMPSFLSCSLALLVPGMVSYFQILWFFLSPLGLWTVFCLEPFCILFLHNSSSFQGSEFRHHLPPISLRWTLKLVSVFNTMIAIILTHCVSMLRCSFPLSKLGKVRISSCSFTLPASSTDWSVFTEWIILPYAIKPKRIIEMLLGT